jgi:hypothetical protein
MIRSIQKNHFLEDYNALRQSKSLPGRSLLKSLQPFMDSTGLMRVGGRLQNSYLEYEAKHPILLPKQHPVTQSIIMHYHVQFLHAGPQCLLANIRQRYWPIGGIKAVSSVVNKCIRCFRARPNTLQQVMAPLPADRLTPSPTFYVTGIGFCGPFFSKSEVRNRAATKCNIAIFICKKHAI